MKTKYIFIIYCMLLILLSCEQKNEIESLYNHAEKLEAEILNGVQTLTEYQSNYEKILVNAPECELAPIVCYKFGKLNEIYGHYEKAIEYYQKLFLHYHEYEICSDGLFNTAQIYQLHLDKIEEALITYQQLISFYPNSEIIFQAYLQYGQLLSKKNRWDEVVENFKQIILKFPDNKICDDLTFRIADIYATRLNNIENAVKTYKQLVEKYPDSSWQKHAASRIAELN